MSPFSALISAGEYVSRLSPPTVTMWSVAFAYAAKALSKMELNRIFLF